MMKRIGVNLTSLIFCLLLLIPTGCEVKKEVIDTEQFNTIMSDNKFSITDVTDQYAAYDFIKSVSVAIDENKKYQVEFYILDSDENAHKMFESNKSNFEKNTDKNALTAEATMNNYSFFSITDNSNYKYICRVENTLVYVDTVKENKDEVKDIIKKLGY